MSLSRKFRFWLAKLLIGNWSFVYRTQIIDTLKPKAGELRIYISNCVFTGDSGVEYSA